MHDSLQLSKKGYLALAQVLVLAVCVLFPARAGSGVRIVVLVSLGKKVRCLYTHPHSEAVHHPVRVPLTVVPLNLCTPCRLSARTLHHPLAVDCGAVGAAHVTQHPAPALPCQHRVLL